MKKALPVAPLYDAAVYTALAYLEPMLLGSHPRLYPLLIWCALSVWLLSSGCPTKPENAPTGPEL